MNWVGGVRNRIRMQHDKKKQKEFFEKQKYVRKVNAALENQSPSKVDGISQDLQALQSIIKVSNELDHGKQEKFYNKVKMVDLDKLPNVKKKHMEEVDLGPVSPTRLLQVADISNTENRPSSLFSTHSGGISAKSENVYLSTNLGIEQKSDRLSGHHAILNDSLITPVKKRCFGQKDTSIHKQKNNELFTPCNLKYHNHQNQNKVTFSNKVTTRTQTPESELPLTSLYSSTTESEKINRKHRNVSIFNKNTTMEKCDAENVSLDFNFEPLQTRNIGTYLNIGTKKFESETNPKWGQDEITSMKNVRHRPAFTTQNSWKNESRSHMMKSQCMALTSEDFQTTPLYNYIRKEKQRNRMREYDNKSYKNVDKMSTSDEKVKESEKENLEHVENIKAAKPWWALLDDGMFNKLQPSVSSVQCNVRDNDTITTSGDQPKESYISEITDRSESSTNYFSSDGSEDGFQENETMCPLKSNISCNNYLLEYYDILAKYQCTPNILLRHSGNLAPDISPLIDVPDVLCTPNVQMVQNTTMVSVTPPVVKVDIGSFRTTPSQTNAKSDSIDSFDGNVKIAATKAEGNLDPYCKDNISVNIAETQTESITVIESQSVCIGTDIQSKSVCIGTDIQSKSVCIGTDNKEYESVETQTECILDINEIIKKDSVETQTDNNCDVELKLPVLKDAGVECHVLKEPPATVNVFSQTDDDN